MTALFSTRRLEFSPTGPVFHIKRTRKRKPALDPEARELHRTVISKMETSEPDAVTRCEGCLHQPGKRAPEK